MSTTHQGKGAMPLLIDDADFNVKLLAPSKNAEHTARFLEKGTEPFSLPGYIVPPHYSFRKSLNTEEYRLIAPDNEGNPGTIYAVRVYFHSEITHPHRACSQVMVWRALNRKHQFATRDLPERFFAYLLESHDIVVSDGEQTADGQRFWLKMLEWAWDSGYHVYMADGTQEGYPRYKLQNMDELMEHFYASIWGNDRDIHPHRRAIISKSDLASVPLPG